MFIDRPNNHDTQESENFNPVLIFLTTSFIESMLHTNFINMTLWCLVINDDYHLIDAFCLDVLSRLHHALWSRQLDGDVLMHGYSK